MGTGQGKKLLAGRGGWGVGVRWGAHCPGLQPCRSSLAALAARTSLDLELDLQASRTRQRQLNEELCALRELRQRLEDAQLRGHTDPPAWLLRDERFRSLLREAERQVSERPRRGEGGGPVGGPFSPSRCPSRTGAVGASGVLPVDPALLVAVPDETNQT